MVTVRIPGAMRGLTDGLARVEVPGATVGEALGALVAAHPGVGHGCSTATAGSAAS
jgi:molybdopterin converting factor small subunit